MMHIERLVFDMGKNEFQQAADELKQWYDNMQKLTEDLHTSGWLGQASNREHSEAMEVLLKRLMKGHAAAQAGAAMFPSLQTRLQGFEEQCKSLASKFSS